MARRVGGVLGAVVAASVVLAVAWMLLGGPHDGGAPPVPTERPPAPSASVIAPDTLASPERSPLGNPSANASGPSAGRSAKPSTSPAARPPTAPPGPSAKPSAPAVIARPAPVPSRPGSASAGARWVPPLGNVPWQWELDHPLSLTSAADMGLGATLPGGEPAANPVLYDIDGFDNPASTTAALHAKGFHAICYIEVGAAEGYRPDYPQFPAAVLGSAMPGYPAERYLDIANPVVVSVIEARIRMCAAKGFDGIEPDIDDSYTDHTGFPLTQGGEVAYLRTLSSYAHGLGLAWGLKNGDQGTFAVAMAPFVDFVIDEQCNEDATCSAFTAYVGTKAVFEVEYDVPTSQFCSADTARGWNGVREAVNLAGGRQPCR